MSDSKRLNERLLAQFQTSCAHSGTNVAEANLLAELTQPDMASTDIGTRISRELIQSGFATNVARVLNSLLQRYPEHHELRYWRGNARRISAQSVAAEADFREVLRVDPSHHDAALSLAYMLREQGRMRAAGDVAKASLRARGNDADQTVSALIFLRECGEQARAFDAAQSALERWPDNADIASLAAEFALAIGEFDVAREYLHRTLDQDPAKSASWLRLAYCQRYKRHDDTDFQRIESAWNEHALDRPTLLCVGFALGKTLDDFGDYKRAAAVLRKANTMAQESSRWSVDAWQRFVEQQLVARRLPQIDATADFAPIFVVGLPRTGTTLAATLLGRDRQLRERGELNWIPAMYEHLATQGKLHDRAALSTVARFVCSQMRRDDAPAHWHLDKNPLNFRYLDFITALFPQARIIHCRRNLRDTALSLWTQHFAHADLGFCYDFSSIAQFAHGHDRLMSHWREVLEVPILDLEYEALATDPGSALGGIAKSLGMSALPNTSDASANPRTIVTASVWQARQPVYTRAIGRWKNYAAHLPEIERLF